MTYIYIQVHSQHYPSTRPTHPRLHPHFPPPFRFLQADGESSARLLSRPQGLHSHSTLRHWWSSGTRDMHVMCKALRRCEHGRVPVMWHLLCNCGFYVYCSQSTLHTLRTWDRSRSPYNTRARMPKRVWTRIHIRLQTKKLSTHKWKHFYMRQVSVPAAVGHFLDVESFSTTCRWWVFLLWEFHFAISEDALQRKKKLHFWVSLFVSVKDFRDHGR